MIKKDCPCCGREESVVVYSSGEGECVGNECMCSDRVYCEVKEGTMCACDSRSNGNSSCTTCSQSLFSFLGCGYDNYCDNPLYDCCDIDYDCPRANGCGVKLFFHPIWKKFIYCPECGSYEVEKVSKSIWKFKCTSCGEEFELKRRLK